MPWYYFQWFYGFFDPYTNGSKKSHDSHFYGFLYLKFKRPQKGKVQECFLKRVLSLVQYSQTNPFLTWITINFLVVSLCPSIISLWLWSRALLFFLSLDYIFNKMTLELGCQSNLLTSISLQWALRCTHIVS